MKTPFETSASNWKNCSGHDHRVITKFGHFFSSNRYKRAWPLHEAYENLSKMPIVQDTEIKCKRYRRKSWLGTQKAIKTENQGGASCYASSALHSRAESGKKIQLPRWQILVGANWRCVKDRNLIKIITFIKDLSCKSLAKLQESFKSLLPKTTDFTTGPIRLHNVFLTLEISTFSVCWFGGFIYSKTAYVSQSFPFS